MKKFRWLIILFFAALSIPTTYLVFQTYRGLKQDETEQLRFFGETLFDEIEQELALWVRKEENRAVDEYNYVYTPSEGSGKTVRSPLSRPPREDYIVGYLQNNPDGSFQSPLQDKNAPLPSSLDQTVSRLREANRKFNDRRNSGLEILASRPAVQTAQIKKQKKEAEESPGFIRKYLKRSPSREKKEYLGQAEKRVEKITVDQALNVAQLKKEGAPRQKADWGKAEDSGKSRRAPAPSADVSRFRDEKNSVAVFSSDSLAENEESADEILQNVFPVRMKAEIDPMQAVLIDDARIFIFRRIMVNDAIYRQGMVVDLQKFLSHLAAAHFNDQPMSQFTRLELTVRDQSRIITSLTSGASFQGEARFRLQRHFPRPFSFIEANLNCRKIPPSAGRRTLTIIMVMLAGVMLMGLFAIDRSAKTVFEMSERRSQFVSSVTHELKTPLTNIRMYIEMLEQGIAATPEREQAYFSILGSESARLSRLINNILEYSKLEKKQLHFNLTQVDLREVAASVQTVMKETLLSEGFTLQTDLSPIPDVRCDREIMMQVLINLVENSIKFGQKSKRKEITIRTGVENQQVLLSVSDTGPGIPKKALKKVFDDFYRVESALVRTTRGTGIGLAFVKKVVTAMGGKVSAKNNDGAGCTIIIRKPIKN